MKVSIKIKQPRTDTTAHVKYADLKMIENDVALIMNGLRKEKVTIVNITKTFVRKLVNERKSGFKAKKAKKATSLLQKSIGKNIQKKDTHMMLFIEQLKEGYLFGLVIAKYAMQKAVQKLITPLTTKVRGQARYGYVNYATKELLGA